MDMAFLKGICKVSLLMLLTLYYADSTMQDSHFSFNHPRIKKLIEPLSYNLLLRVPSEGDYFIFDGTTVYFFILENPTSKIYLNAHELTIEEKRLELMRHPYTDDYYPRNYYYSSGTFSFDFERDVPSGFYRMVIKFRGNISENEIGFYRATCEDCNGAAKWILTTQLKPTAARRVFPCWDEPSLKTRFGFDILHHPNYTVLSNMPLDFQMSFNDIMMTRFLDTPPIPTYLIAFSLTNFNCYDKSGSGFTTRVCCRPSVKDQITIALNISFDVALYMQRYIEISPQLSEITNIGLPDSSYGATGNWGLNIYRETHLMHNETLHSIDHKLDVSVYVASMVALQWFGNLVSPTWWTHMWFFQTLALFYGAKAAAETYNDKDIKCMFTYRLQSLARENNAVSKMHPVTYGRNNRNEFDRLIKSYHLTNCLKGYAIMVMLEYAVTETIFRSATTKYLKKHQFSSATPNDFWDFIQDEIDNGEQKSLYNRPSIAEIVQIWLKQRSLPVITVKRGNLGVLIIDQEYTSTEKDGDNTDDLWVPINYVTKSTPENALGIMWLERQILISVFGISAFDWVIVNWQHAGYYRVRYDDWSLQRLTYCLDSENYEKIHVLSRAHIIEDAYFFWSQFELNFIRFHGLVSFMHREKQCAPWYAMQNVFQKMRTFLKMKAGGVIKRLILLILHELLLEVGYTEHPDDLECVKFKRLLATKWACRLSHNKCLEIAKERLIEHLKDPESHIIPPMWKEWTYCNGLVLSNMSTWSEVSREFRKTKNMRILEYLGCSGNSSIIVYYLSQLMSDNPLQLGEFELSIEDRQRIYRSTVEKHMSRIEVFDYVLRRLRNLMNVEFDDDPFVEELSYVIENVYSLVQMEMISSLLEEPHILTDNLVYMVLTLKIERQKIRIRELKQLAN